MEILRTEFIDAMKFLKPAIGNNESRKNLTYLHAKTKGKELVFTAADSFLIKRVILESEDKDEESDFLIDKKTLECFIKVCKVHNDKYNCCEPVKIKNDQLNSQLVRMGFVQPGLEYPNLEKLINTDYKEHTGETFMGVRHQAIENCLKGFQNYGGKSVLKFQSKGPETPLKITSQDGLYIAVLMPVRIKW